MPSLSTTEPVDDDDDDDDDDARERTHAIDDATTRARDRGAARRRLSSNARTPTTNRWCDVMTGRSMRPAWTERDDDDREFTRAWER